MPEQGTEDVNELEIEAEDDAELPIEVEDPRQRLLLSEPVDYVIGDLHTRHKDGRLVVQPDFQRYYVFDDTKASRLVESVLMGVPIPVVYLAEEDDYSYTVIDGHQRLFSFFRFLDNQLGLVGLNVFSERNGSKFQELPRDLQNKVREGKLRAIVIKRESPPEIRFDIFERLNTGAVNLNAQELRNCVYRGRYNELLRALAADQDSLRLFGRKHPDRRMRDREAIVRFFALCQNLTTYQPPMKRFLNREMENYCNMSEEAAREMTQLFKKSVTLTLSVFGEHAFKRFYPGTDQAPDGRWEPKRLNMALYDVVMVGFTGYEKHQVITRADAVRDALIDLMVEDTAFVDAITTGTSDRDKVQTRTQRWMNRLGEVLGAPETHRRLFPPELKRQMFERNPICGICGQSVHIIDDAHVDHVEQWHKGGQTIPENARLTHRFCNSSRRRNE